MGGFGGWRKEPQISLETTQRNRGHLRCNVADGGPQFTVPLASLISKSYFAGTMANARLPMKISYCTTCRNRIEHLQQTLPRTLSALRDGDELVILDYGSAEPMRPVVARFCHPAIQLYRIAQTPRFRVAHAKNVAHRLAT